MFSAVAVNIANVIARHVFHAPFIWAEEILIYTMIWTIFVGIILVSGKQAHLKMDLVAAAFPVQISQKISVAIEAIIVVVCLIMVFASAEVLITLGGYGQRSVVAEIPMVIPHLAIPLSFALICILHFISLIKKIRLQINRGNHD
jgi:C4-dicarboxylate transporter DctQ subunit